jgi:hypothetical protein
MANVKHILLLKADKKKKEGGGGVIGQIDFCSAILN